MNAVRETVQILRCARLTAVSVAALGLILGILPCTASGQDVEIEWIRQFGGLGGAITFARAVDSAGAVYVLGETTGFLPGQTYTRGGSFFLRKYDADGNEVWTRQFGTADSDWARAVALDATGVYVAGATEGSLPGQVHFGGPDAFVSKYDASGNEVWTRQFGTSGSDFARSVCMDDSGVYVAGMTDGALPGETSLGTWDAFVRKYDLAGNELWTDQFGTDNGDDLLGIVADGSTVHVAGFTEGALPGQVQTGGTDAFIRQYSSGGNVLWTRQFGTGYGTQASGISNDETGVYVAGWTHGAFPGQASAGSSDAFVRKYDSAGNVVWTRQFGSAGWESDARLDVQGSSIYIVGRTDGAFPGQSSAGYHDIFVRKYDSNGATLWTRQFGTTDQDEAGGVSADGTGLYVCGKGGTFPGQSWGSDAFVRKYDGDGNELWTRQFGGLIFDSFDIALAAAAADGIIYVAGLVYGGSLPGQSTEASGGFLRTYDGSGNEIWTCQFGVSEAAGIGLDTTGVYVGGRTYVTLPGQVSAGGGDAFVRKYDPAGNDVWTRQFGTPSDDSVRGVAVDATGVYLAGDADGTLAGQVSAGGYDAFVRKYDAVGSELWTRQFGTSSTDYALAVAADATGVYVAGAIPGMLPGQFSAGSYDAFVRKYDAAGNELWTCQFGTPEQDAAFAVCAAGGAIYVGGQTYGSLPGQTSAGDEDAYVRKYDMGGNLVWTRQFGTSFEDWVHAVWADDTGVYLAGGTRGAFPGQTSAGMTDSFVRAYGAAGNELWTRQLGTPLDDGLLGITAAGPEIYVVGWTQDTPTRWGDSDAYVVKLLIVNTPIGSGVVVEPVDRQTNTSPVKVTFSQVTQAGATSLVITGAGLPPPTGSRLGNPPRYYELTTTAVYSGPIEVCIDYTATSFGQESTVRLFHREGDEWIDATTSVDTVNNIICGTVTSLSEFAIFELENQPPVCDVAGPYGAECAGVTTTLQLDGSSSSDPDNDLLTYAWSSNCPGASFDDPASPTPILTVDSSSVCPNGLVCEVTLTASDGRGGEDTCSTTVTIRDTTAPDVTCAVNLGLLDRLWPPNHDLANVGLSISVADACDPNPAAEVRVYGDEDDEEDTGDGVHSPDAKDIAAGTLRLRSERKGDGDGRVYLIVVRATDSCGNVGTACCTVIVPRSMSQAGIDAVLAQAAAARAFCEQYGDAPPSYYVVGDGPVIGPRQ